MLSEESIDIMVQWLNADIQFKTIQSYERLLRETSLDHTQID